MDRSWGIMLIEIRQRQMLPDIRRNQNIGNRGHQGLGAGGSEQMLLKENKLAVIR